MVFVSNPLLELEHELAISKRVSGHAPAQSLKHERSPSGVVSKLAVFTLEIPIESA
jgi:hypothetical protein